MQNDSYSKIRCHRSVDGAVAPRQDSRDLWQNKYFPGVLRTASWKVLKLNLGCPFSCFTVSNNNNNNTFYLTAPFRSLKDTLQIKNSLKQGQTNNKTIKVQVKTRQLQ